MFCARFLYELNLRRGVREFSQVGFGRGCISNVCYKFGNVDKKVRVAVAIFMLSDTCMRTQRFLLGMYICQVMYIV